VTPSATEATLRVLSYNVRSLRAGADRVAAVIQDSQADVVCVQEAPRLVRWRAKRAALAREAGLLVATADRLGGLTILASLRVQVRSTKLVALSRTSGLPARALVAAELEVAGHRFAVGCTHLGIDAGERERHAADVRAVLDRMPAPIVLAGDFNAAAGSAPRRILADGWDDPCRQATYPARAPRRSIDGVIAGPGAEIRSCEVPRLSGLAAASDHLPVLAILAQS
jgi:endonuclease/exonuclease/phosphatase family metal-dependent hydrolase